MNKNRQVLYTEPWYKIFGTNNVIPINDNWKAI